MLVQYIGFWLWVDVGDTVVCKWKDLMCVFKKVQTMFEIKAYLEESGAAQTGLIFYVLNILQVMFYWQNL